MTEEPAVAGREDGMLNALYPLSLMGWTFEGAMLALLVVSRFTAKGGRA